MIEHVGELKVETPVIERLVMEVPPHNQRRGWHEVHADGVGHPDPPEGLHLLAHSGADAEGGGGVGEQVLTVEIAEEGGEDPDLAVPVAGGPDLAELGVEGFVELVVDVGVVGGVAGSDLEVREG